MQEISDESGYNSISYFSALFRKQTGLTPTAYRNRME
ncbi:MAG: helix-turn-helix domain-containing protein [Lachnospiraceae bacterium]|nr:helix-turn-helix domain-containing protein [Lachnospiraceae bacterium]